MIKIPKHIQELQPYVAGKPIEELAREKDLKRIVKLASNENPLGPSPKAVGQ
jgi:histidinol-phosphate aminotransferase